MISRLLNMRTKGGKMSSGSIEFGRRIKELRMAHKLTQEGLAELVGLEYQTISRIETGCYFTNYNNLSKLAKAFKMEIKDLFDYGHIKKPDSLKEELKSDIDLLSPPALTFLKKFLQGLKEFSPM